jgi:hypothetical protein
MVRVPADPKYLFVTAPVALVVTPASAFNQNEATNGIDLATKRMFSLLTKP